MCWLGKDNKKIAKDDIKVFKLVTGDEKSSFFSSVYCKFKYELGFAYLSRIKKIPSIYSEFIRIYNGIHSYSYDCRITTLGNRIYIRNCKSNEVLDHFNKVNLFCDHNFYRLECIIPKRSGYYENSRGEIVSSRLKIIKAIKLYIALGFGVMVTRQILVLKLQVRIL